MIIKEIITLDNKQYQLFSSDNNKQIRNKTTGLIYDTALELLSTEVEYEETDINIIAPEEEMN